MPTWMTETAIWYTAAATALLMISSFGQGAEAFSGLPSPAKVSLLASARKPLRAISVSPARSNVKYGLKIDMESADTTGKTPSCLVVGGGIGGLAAAVALTKAGVKDVKVYERSSESAWKRAGAGTGLSLFPNGMAALHAIDPELHRMVLEEGGVIETFGRPEAGGVANGFKDKYGHPMVGIRWSALKDILASMLPPGTMVFGKVLDGIGQAPNGRAEVIFRNDGWGASRVPADCVIGADGIRSNTRHLLQIKGDVERRIGNSPKVQPTDHGRDFVRGIVPLSAALPSLGGKAGTWMGPLPGGVGATMPVGKGGTYWAVTKFDVEGRRVYSELKEANDGSLKPHLLKDIESMPDLAALIAATDEASIYVGRQAEMPQTPSFVWGRVGLLGDAAHAMPVTAGQGANTALEDAAQLGVCLKGVGPDGVVGGLQAYDEARRERCWAIQNRSKMLLQGGGGTQPSNMTEEEYREWLYTFKPTASL